MKNVKTECYWKIKSMEYINSLQKFLDRADNIKDEELKQSVIMQMLKCDEILTQLAENEIKKVKVLK